MNNFGDEIMRRGGAGRGNGYGGRMARIRDAASMGRAEREARRLLAGEGAESTADTAVARKTESTADTAVAHETYEHGCAAARRAVAPTLSAPPAPPAPQALPVPGARSPVPSSPDPRSPIADPYSMGFQLDMQTASGILDAIRAGRRLGACAAGLFGFEAPGAVRSAARALIGDGGSLALVLETAMAEPVEPGLECLAVVPAGLRAREAIRCVRMFLAFEAGRLDGVDDLRLAEFVAGRA